MQQRLFPLAIYGTQFEMLRLAFGALAAVALLATVLGLGYAAYRCVRAWYRLTPALSIVPHFAEIPPKTVNHPTDRQRPAA